MPHFTLECDVGLERIQWFLVVVFVRPVFRTKKIVFLFIIKTTFEKKY